ncbi:MAG: UDPGP type 1 family protein [Phycisphaerales bacterium]|nr:UDPGP type 1 family protein [Phycisphaerales bacterium]
MNRLEALRPRIEAAGQNHLLVHAESLPSDLAVSFCQRLESIHWEQVPDLVERFVVNCPPSTTETLSAPSCVTAGGPLEGRGSDLIDRAATLERGESLIAEGKVAAFTVAGGQGTRLGWNGPKGTYPASPVSGKPLFRLFAEQLLAAQRQYGCLIRWYIMTSEMNNESTRKFLLDNRCFGLDRTQIMLVEQGMMPTFDATTGHILLESPGVVAMSPDGHGGSFAALQQSGALDQMQARGVEVLSYFQVDNPLVRAIDPLLLGLHVDPAQSSAQFSSKMVQRAGPDEKVGVFCRIGDRIGVVEYSDLTSEQAQATDVQGRLRFAAGNIAVHAVGVDFAQSIARGGEKSLPWHRAEKKVPHVCPDSGVDIQPTAPNAVKLERFVFDALGQAEQPAILEVVRAEEFAPIKNATGLDSAQTSRQLQSDLYGQWLEQAGVSIPRKADGSVDATIEISPLTAMAANELMSLPLPDSLKPSEQLIL